MLQILTNSFFFKFGSMGKLTPLFEKFSEFGKKLFLNIFFVASNLCKGLG